MTSPPQNTPRPHDSDVRPPDSPLLLQLAREKSSVSSRLCAVLLICYFGFIGALAFAPQVLEGRIGSATLGIPLGIGLILLCCLLTGAYVRWANTRHDDLVKQILRGE